ncbi:MAG: hypothetical protein ACYTHK_04765 [Planctomycetota bacterium]
MILSLLCACTSGRTWSTGEQSEEEIRKILARRDVREASVALNDAVFLVPAPQLAAERDALLAALAGGMVDREPPPYDVEVETRDQVLAWARSEVVEFQYDDGRLHVERKPGGSFVVSFEQGKDVRWIDLKPSAGIDAHWRAYTDAARRMAKPDPRRSWSDRPLDRLRDVGR